MQEKEFDIFSVIQLLKNNLKWLAILFVVFFTLILAYSFTQLDTTYLTKTTGYSTSINDNVLADKVNNLQLLIEGKDMPALANTLALNIEEAKSINSIAAEALDYDKMEVIDISLIIADSLLVDQVKAGIAAYIMSDSLLYKLNQSKRDALAYGLEKVNKELEDAQNAESNGIVISVGDNIPALLNYRENYVKDLATFSFFEYNTDSTTNRNSKGTLFTLSASLLGAFSLAVITILLLSFIRLVGKQLD